MSVFEVLMLVCFGLSWPISIAKAVRTRQVAGKSRLFLFVIIVGYISGMAHKVLYSFDWVIWLYALNAAMVTVDLLLCLHYTQVARSRCPPTRPADAKG